MKKGKPKAKTWFLIAEFLASGRGRCLCLSAHTLFSDGAITHAEYERVLGVVNVELLARNPAARVDVDGIVRARTGYGVYLWPAGLIVPRIQFCTEQIRNQGR